jgi:hypothetical protein
MADLCMTNINAKAGGIDFMAYFPKNQPFCTDILENKAYS